MGQLQEKLAEDLATTPRADSFKRELLKTLIAEIKLKKGNNPSDEDILSIIRKFKSNAIECKNEEEIPILDLYLPKVLNESQTKIFIQSIITLNNYSSPKDLGKVMKDLKDIDMGNVTIDNKIASQIAKELLS